MAPSNFYHHHLLKIIITVTVVVMLAPESITSFLLPSYIGKIVNVNAMLELDGT